MVVASSGNSFNKEISIRRRITSIFNKREDDFPSLKEYNDYLEEVEDMTWNLIEGRDIAAIEAKIAKYEEENREQIVNSRARKAEERAAASAAIRAPVYGDTDMATDQNTQTGVSVTAQGQYAPAIAGGAFMQPRPTHQPVPLGGPDLNLDDEEMTRLKAERGGRAGGWTPEFGRKRALEEAFGSLWL
ncbi:hypothetical protein RND81_07G076000 [Saponaria officinalis]|uniref:MAT1 centre domain-containing protein n=1 Tax=Saponaria officinalis TaxID=3572 RepID=A0AAW1JNM5_SAPOF